MGAARTDKAGDCRQQMENKDGQVTHATILPRQHRAEFLMIQFATDNIGYGETLWLRALMGTALRTPRQPQKGTLAIGSALSAGDGYLHSIAARSRLPTRSTKVVTLQAPGRHPLGYRFVLVQLTLIWLKKCSGNHRSRGAAVHAAAASQA